MEGKKCGVIFLLPIVVEKVGNMAAIRSLKWHQFSLKNGSKIYPFCFVTSWDRLVDGSQYILISKWIQVWVKLGLYADCNFRTSLLLGRMLVGMDLRFFWLNFGAILGRKINI